MLKIEVVNVENIKDRYREVFFSGSRYNWIRCQKDMKRNVRVYFYTSGRLDNLLFTHKNLYNECRKLLPDVVRQAGLPEDTKFRWSPQAGDPSGDDPGFIAEGGVKGQEIFVEVSYGE